MGKGSSGGQNTVVQQSQPPAQYLNAYSNAVQQAQNVASTPYQNYSGNLIAPLSPDQTAGIQATESAYGLQAPYLNSAANYISGSTAPLLTPGVSNYINQAGTAPVASTANNAASNVLSAAGNFTPGGIQQWESPYTSQVVGATEQQFNTQNAEQQSQLAGNAVSQGAFGGDRDAVAQALLAGQQQTAEAPVIAQTEQQGFNTALGAEQQAAALGLQGATTAGQFGMQGATTQAQLEQQAGQTLLGANEAQGWLGSQAGYGMSNLGNEALSTGLTGANALLGVGGLEQQQAQESLNVPYEQWIAQQAYPFQTTGWESGIAEGLGSAAGGTSSTQYPGASIASQLGGTALTGAGLLGETGAFGSNGYLTGANGLLSGIGGGGGLSAATLSGIAGSAIADEGIPAAAAAAGAFGVRRGGEIPYGMRPARRAPGGPISVSVDSAGVPQLSTTPISNFTGNPQSVSNYLSSVAASAAPRPTAAPASAGMQPASATPPMGTQNVGGYGNIIPGQSYPSAVPTTQAAPITPSSAYSYPVSPNSPGFNPMMYYAPQMPASSGGGGQARGGMVRRDSGGAIDQMADQAYLAGLMQPEGQAQGGMIRVRRDAGGMMPADEMPPVDETMTPDGPPAQSAPPVGMQPNYGVSDPWKALMYAGLGVMGGNSPNALQNFGAGALKGLQLYDTERRTAGAAQSLAAYRQQQGQLAAKKEGVYEGHLKVSEDQAAQRLAQQASEAAERLKAEWANVGIHAGEAGDTASYHRGMLGLDAQRETDLEAYRNRPDYTVQAGTDANGNPVLVDPHTGKPLTVPGVTPKGGRDPLADQFRANQEEDTSARAIMAAKPGVTYDQALAEARKARGTAGNAPLPNHSGVAPPVPHLPVPPGATDALRRNPLLAPQFIEKYGAPAYQQFLNVAPAPPS